MLEIYLDKHSFASSSENEYEKNIQNNNSNNKPR